MDAASQASRLVLSVRAFEGVTVIDGGGTLVLQAKGAEGQSIRVLVPHRLAAELFTELGDALTVAANIRGRVARDLDEGQGP